MSDGRATEQLSTRYKTGTVLVAFLYVGMALLAAVLAATPGTSEDPAVNAGLLQGQVVGYFGCCASIPVLLALGVQALMRMVRKGNDGHTHFVKVLFWVLVALLPFQILSFAVTILKTMGGVARPS